MSSVFDQQFPAVFDQQFPAVFWRRHPLMVACAAALLCWALAHGWYATAIVSSLAVAVLGMRRHRRTECRRRAALRARADYEHLLSLAGDPRGLYGRYPPVQPGWFPDPGRAGQWRYFDGTFWTGQASPR